jgi:hypothetical protein
MFFKFLSPICNNKKIIKQCLNYHLWLHVCLLWLMDEMCHITFYMAIILNDLSIMTLSLLIIFVLCDWNTSHKFSYIWRFFLVNSSNEENILDWFVATIF